MINNNEHYFRSYLYCTDKLKRANPDHFLRFWKTHSFYTAFPSTDAALGRYIVVVRDCRDVVVSYYHYLKLIGNPVFKCDFETFLQMFAAGCVPGGNYWEWLWDWHRVHQAKKANILWVYYEDLKSDPASEIQRVIQFLNFSDLIHKEEDIATILHNCSFVEMKAMVKNGLDVYVNGFFRKGIVGDHRNELDNKQLDLLNMITNTRLSSMAIRYVTEQKV